MKFDMTSFEPRILVNGSMIRQFSGRTVSIMLRAEEEVGATLIAKSTDNMKIRANITEPQGTRNGDWIEIIGTPAGVDSIRAKEVILFSGDDINFDTEGYNMMVHMLNNCKDIYRQG